MHEELKYYKKENQIQSAGFLNSESSLNNNTSPIGLYYNQYNNKINLPFSIKNLINESEFDNLYKKCYLDNSNKKKSRKNNKKIFHKISKKKK